jgi:hypothetical protein
MVTFSFEAPYEGGSVSCSSVQSFKPYNVTFEPVTTTNAPAVYNPSGVATGGTAWYTISVEPASRFPSNAITWCLAYGDITFVNDNNKGRLIGIQAGSTTNDFRLDVTVEGIYLDPVPTIRGRVFEPKTVPVKAWIVGETDGSAYACNVATVTNMIAYANRILTQSAITLQLNGSVCTTNCTDWMYIAGENGIYPSADELRAIEHNTGGLEMYFVASIGNVDTLGLNGPNGLLLAVGSTGRTMAHEVGHACGLKDVYTESPSNTTLRVDGPITSDRLPRDWGGGYYPAGTEQSEIVQNLLMYGSEDPNYLSKVDIPLGNIYGLSYSWVNNSKEWFLDKINTGLDGMCQQPEHN